MKAMNPKLKYFLNDAGYSCVKLSQKLGLSYWQLFGRLCGEIPIERELVFRLALELGRDFEEISQELKIKGE